MFDMVMKLKNATKKMKIKENYGFDERGHWLCAKVLEDDAYYYNISSVHCLIGLYHNDICKIYLD